MKRKFNIFPAGILIGLIISFSIFLITLLSAETGSGSASESSSTASFLPLTTKTFSGLTTQPQLPDSSSRKYLTLVPPEKRYALLIGINKYNEPKLSPLMSCIKDMNDLKDVLVKYAKFKPENIILMTDDLTGKLFPTAKNIREQVSALKNRIPKDALLIVAFSCHGTMIDHQDGSPVKSYLCAQDTKITNINSFIDREWLFKTIDECPAEKKLLFCDACRSLTTKSQLKSISERTPEGKAIRVMKMETPSKASWNYNYIFMASCSEGQISIDSGVNGLFIAFLLEGIYRTAT